MNIGAMNRRLALQEPVRAADGKGGYKTTWTDTATVWAEFRTPRAAVIQEVGTVTGEIMIECRIRRRSDVRRGWRAVYGGRTYDIVNAYDIDRAETAVWLREVVR